MASAASGSGSCGTTWSSHRRTARRPCSGIGRVQSPAGSHRLPAVAPRQRLSPASSLARPACPEPGGMPQRALVALQLLTGVTGLISALLLAAVPDGSVLHAGPVALAPQSFQ